MLVRGLEAALCWWEAVWWRKKVLNFDALLTLAELVFWRDVTNASYLT